MARKKIESPERLEILMDEFIQKCNSGEIARPTDYNLCVFLGVSPSTIEKMEKGEKTDEGNYEGYSEPFKKLRWFREEFYLNQGDTMAVFALKQKKNGGYTDRQQEDKTPIPIHVTINGAGSNPFG